MDDIVYLELLMFALVGGYLTGGIVCSLRLLLMVPFFHVLWIHRSHIGDQLALLLRVGKEQGQRVASLALAIYMKLHLYYEMLRYRWEERKVEKLLQEDDDDVYPPLPAVQQPQSQRRRLQSRRVADVAPKDDIVTTCGGRYRLTLLGGGEGKVRVEPAPAPVGGVDSHAEVVDADYLLRCDYTTLPCGTKKYILRTFRRGEVETSVDFGQGRVAEVARRSLGSDNKIRLTDEQAVDFVAVHGQHLSGDERAVLKRHLQWMVGLNGSFLPAASDLMGAVNVCPLVDMDALANASQLLDARLISGRVVFECTQQYARPMSLLFLRAPQATSSSTSSASREQADDGNKETAREAH